MPTTPTYPGVYIEEIPSGVRTIIGVATSITAFVGRAARGPVNEPTTIHSYADYERSFGGLWADSTMSFAVRDFFLNGGSEAVIVRLVRGAKCAGLWLTTSGPNAQPLELEAASPGSWGDNLVAYVTYGTKDADKERQASWFNLEVQELDSDSGRGRPDGAIPECFDR